MTSKDYEKRINDALAELKADPELRSSVYDGDEAPERIGDLFQIVADLTEGGADGSRLFRDAGLSPQNPFHFAYLIEALANVHYNDGKKGHPPRNFAHCLTQQLQSLADKHKEYRVEHLARLYIRKCPDRIPSLKTWKGVKSAMRHLGIKIKNPQQ